MYQGGGVPGRGAFEPYYAYRSSDVAICFPYVAMLFGVQSRSSAAQRTIHVTRVLGIAITTQSCTYEQMGRGIENRNTRLASGVALRVVLEFSCPNRKGFQMFEPFPPCTGEVDLECLECTGIARIIVTVALMVSVVVSIFGGFGGVSRENGDGDVTTQTVSSQ